MRMPVGGLDSVVNTYSAVGVDGIHYTFEEGARFDHATRPVIDPAATIYNGKWYYMAPIGAPQEGAYQATSNDGRVFTRIADNLSDNQHNWTGNLLVDESNTMQFYGSGPTLWRAAYEGEGRWGAFTSIGLKGGDPSAVARRNNARRMIIYVGPRYVTSVEDAATTEPRPSIAPTLVRDVLCADDEDGMVECIDGDGRVSSVQLAGGRADVSHLSSGLYVARNSSHRVLGRFIKFQ